MMIHHNHEDPRATLVNNYLKTNLQIDGAKQ